MQQRGFSSDVIAYSSVRGAVADTGFLDSAATR